MSDLVGSFIQGGYNWLAQERSFQQQKELQNDAQNFNQMMFNLANQYNSPLAQMSRFKNAGLNPNLIYGQMANTASPIGMSSSSAPTAANMQAPSLLETAQIGLIDAQKENIKADTAEKNQNIVESGSRIEKINAEIDKIGHDNNWTDQQIEESKATMNKIYADTELVYSQRDQVRQAIENLKSEKNLTDQQVIAQQIDNYWADERNRAQINELKSRMRLNDAQAKELLELLIYKQANLASSTALNDANTDRIKRLVSAEEYKLLNEGFLAGEQGSLIGAQGEQQKVISQYAKDHPGWHYFWGNVAPSVASAVGTVAGIAGAIIIRGGMKGRGAKGAAQKTIDAWDHSGVYGSPEQR